MNVLGPDFLLVIAAAVMAGGGVYLALERSLTRVAVGLVLVGNAVNLLFIITGGPRGGAPIVGVTPEEAMSDPLPQAMVLTAIVITLALTAFLVAMAHRSWQLHRHDEVQDDLEDRRIARLAGFEVRGETDWITLDEEAAGVRDETADIVEEHWLAEEPDHRWRAVEGTLCFADVSGFTALSERLESRGRRGAEELVDTLNRVFGAILDVAAGRGGELLSRYSAEANEELRRLFGAASLPENVPPSAAEAERRR